VLDGAHLICAYLDRFCNALPQIVVAYDKSEQTEIASLIDRATRSSVTSCVTYVDDALFKTLSPVDTPTGVIAVISIPEHSEVHGSHCLLLDEVQDPGNMGSILRTALAADFRRVYLSSGCTDPWSPKCLRGGMGAQFGLRIEEDVSLTHWLTRYEGQSVACDARAQTSLYELHLTAPLAVILGAEGRGLSSEVLDAASLRCRIPMAQGTESLNVGAAAAIVMYESLRQRQASQIDTR